MAHLIIGGRDTRDFGLTLTSVDMRPPAPKEIIVSGNGFDGSIDLTSWTGRTFFNDRYMKFEFVYTDYTDPTSFETCKSTVASVFHGKRLGFRLSWDSASLYTGRWRVESTVTDGHHGVISLTCTADPFKTVDVTGETVNFAGGVWYVPNSISPEFVRMYITVGSVPVYVNTGSYYKSFTTAGTYEIPIGGRDGGIFIRKYESPTASNPEQTTVSMIADRQLIDIEQLNMYQFISAHAFAGIVEQYFATQAADPNHNVSFSYQAERV